MPTYEITGANGKKYRVTGENPEGALAALKKMEAGAPSSGKVNPDGLDAPRSFAQGMADIATFGLADEAAAAVGSLGGMLPGGHGKGYSVLLDEIRGQSEAEAEANPGMHLAGQVAGGVGNAAGLVKGGLSLAGNALKAGEPLKRVIAASAADGGIERRHQETGKILAHQQHDRPLIAMRGEIGEISHVARRADHDQVRRQFFFFFQRNFMRVDV